MIVKWGEALGTHMLTMPCAAGWPGHRAGGFCPAHIPALFFSSGSAAGFGQRRTSPPAGGVAAIPRYLHTWAALLSAEKTFQLPITSWAWHKGGGCGAGLPVCGAYCRGSADLQTRSCESSPAPRCAWNEVNAREGLRLGEGLRRRIKQTI